MRIAATGQTPAASSVAWCQVNKSKQLWSLFLVNESLILFWRRKKDLDGGALIREGTAEESGDDVDDAGGDVVFQRSVGVLAVVRGTGNQRHIDEETTLEQRPHVIRCVDLLHFHLRVDVAVVQKVDVYLLHLQ